ncbi:MULTISPECIES: undecaprenyl-diphosphate phosphatase [Enterococcus]|uniref:Undecaprenyl-diphosphatase n=1 Tax=Enterococcus thailandicus TaxID=417368 RepID=A0A179EVD7_ENTTH|nr:MULTISPECIES: undecaprenyl-diphosphate phosphatase [Enterococcus]ASZ07775.1 undecaprenyl-diphosphate phosphatase [Enterococcus thailandicus]MDA3963910.1 undecaprenyl-diphosphate phosphatase [Enterococcus thailandicus]MDT2750529.1 undecaprenyl-diphosphate phosphatase [Enterococcus thailandicus]MDT2775089.1 undecaprenyl-diphosphate phosphatase [Enterococcus thailandicus]MDT2793585.1 undecaprenyl-diphosphate phosphatase [Enterococcus thailandicus]
MFFANVIKAVILGIIEGITEWLPISSTGHLILADEFIKLDASTQFMSMFNVVIQLGAILAVVVLYFHKLNPFSPSKTAIEKKDTWSLWFKVVVACLPAVIIGLPLDDWLEEHFHNFLSVAIVLIIYGIAFIIVEKRNKTRKPRWESLNDFTYQAALMVGLFQVLALVPGTSRSGATILGAIIIGASRFVATEFSFFLGIPVMFGASGLKIVKYLMEGNTFGTEETVVLLVGTLVSFIVSILAIKFLLSYLKKNDFTAFGWYRIILGIILIGYWFISM